MWTFHKTVVDPFIAETNDLEQLNLQEQHLKLQCFWFNCSHSIATLPFFRLLKDEGKLKSKQNLTYIYTTKPLLMKHD